MYGCAGEFGLGFAAVLCHGSRLDKNWVPDWKRPPPVDGEGDGGGDTAALRTVGEIIL